MCGISGFISPDFYGADKKLVTMLSSLSHRGPDDFGHWFDGDSGVALGHRRLSILDLSPAGHQPMVSACGRYVIVFNGEIYNWKELRAALDTSFQAPLWRGHSDTEVLLAAVVAWGLPDTLKRIRGMFALALWDRNERCLLLARDRIGEKPLYYGYQKGSFFFGSELKSLSAAPGWTGEVDSESFSLFIRYGYVPTPRSIYQNVFKLTPGTYLRFDVNGVLEEPKIWWNFLGHAQNGVDSRSVLSDTSAIDALDRVLGEAVEEQMVADVPLGALLSGGLDSSLIVALMQSRSAQPVRTFTIGFSEGDYDEATHAKRVARHLGVEHTELYVSPDEALNIIPTLPEMYDEPFGDSSQIPTALVCALTRQHVSVCLSGDAGDEFFGGYNRYFWAESLWNQFGRIPLNMRKMLAAGVSTVPAGGWNALFHLLRPVMPKRFRVTNPGDKLHKLSEILGAMSPETLYFQLVSQWRGALPLQGIVEPETLVSSAEQWPQFSKFSEQMMALDTLTYLPDDILVKVDRAAMAASLETRVPFLDPRVIDFAWKLPFNQKIRDGQGKWLLRQLLYRYVPRDLVDRPKQGFGVPIEHWLRGPLREWAEELLSPAMLEADGLLDSAAIRRIWKAHLGGRNMQHALWNVLMYQAWRARWL